MQTIRKEAEFEVTYHIRVSVNGSDKVAKIVEKNIEAVSGKVLADAIVTDETLAVSREWNVNGEKVTIGVEKTEK